jgi:hypothetical protein
MHGDSSAIFWRSRFFGISLCALCLKCRHCNQSKRKLFAKLTSCNDFIAEKRKALARDTKHKDFADG